MPASLFPPSGDGAAAGDDDDDADAAPRFLGRATMDREK